MHADLHQIPLFIRVGADAELVDLAQECRDAVEVASKKRDLKALDAEVKLWFDERH